MGSLEQSRLLLYRIYYKWSTSSLTAIFIKGFQRQLKFNELKIFFYSLNLQYFRIMSNTYSNMSNLYFYAINVVELILYQNCLFIDLIHQK